MVFASPEPSAGGVGFGKHFAVSKSKSAISFPVTRDWGDAIAGASSGVLF